MSDSSLPAPLATIVDAFKSAPKMLKLPLLLEYAEQLSPVPSDVDVELEQVDECQTPLFLHAHTREDGIVELWFEAPPEAPTTRSFAAIVQQGLTGLTREEILAVPIMFHKDMGLSELISPLRIRGLEAIMIRVKRQLGSR